MTNQLLRDVALTPRWVDVWARSRQQWLSLLHHSGSFDVRLGILLGHLILECESPIVKDLQKQYNVGQRVVDGQDGHGRQHALQYRPENVKNIAEEPHHDKDDRQSFCRATAEILNDLR